LKAVFINPLNASLIFWNPTKGIERHSPTNFAYNYRGENPTKGIESGDEDVKEFIGFVNPTKGIESLRR